MDILLISLTELRMFFKYLSQAWRWTCLVIDEAHKIKNQDSKTFESLCEIGADFKLLITATPIINSVADLWNIMFYLNYDYVGKKLNGYKFQENDTDAVTMLNLVC